MARPSMLPRWATGGDALLTEPAEGRKDRGFDVGARLPAQVLNWLLRVSYDWMDWINVEAPAKSEANTFALLQTYTSGVLSRGIAQLLGGAADSSPVIQTLIAGGFTRKLLWEAGTSAVSSTTRLRIYVTAAGALEATYNAWWDSSIAKWRSEEYTLDEANHSTYAHRLRLGSNGVTLQQPVIDVGGPFEESKWRTVGALAPRVAGAPMALVYGASSQNPATTGYLMPPGRAAGAPASVVQTIPCPVAGRITGLFAASGPPGSGALTITVIKNGAVTPLVVSLYGSDVKGQDTARNHEVVVAEGDLIGVQASLAAGATALAVPITAVLRIVALV